MQTSATIISLVGQAWARDANGALRTLKVGDRLESDEVLISTTGSRIDLSFDEGQIVTVLGEHEVTFDDLAPVAVPAATLADATPTAAPDSATDTSASDRQKEGHGFVQLVRLEESTEADGFTPVRLSRVDEPIVRSVMPYVTGEESLQRTLEHVGTRDPDSAYRNPDRLFSPPKASIEIDAIAGDDIISATEAGGVITLSGTVGLDVRSGDTVTVTVNGKTYTTKVNADGTSWNVDVPGIELAADNRVHASVTTANAAGTKGSARAERPYDVDVTFPLATPIAPVGSEDAQTVSLDVSTNFIDPDGDPLTYSATNLPAGLTIDPTTGLISGTLERSASQGGTGGVYRIEVTATDPVGNSVSQMLELTVTNPSPVAQDDAGTTDENSPLHTGPGAGVLINDHDPDGDPITVSEVNGIAADVSTPVTGSHGGLFTINSDGSYSFDPNGEFDDLAQGESRTSSIAYTVNDGEGGTDTATLTVTVTGVNNAPTPVGTIADQSGNDADLISGLDITDYFTDIDTSDVRKYTADGLPKGLSIDPDTGLISGTIDRAASQDAPNGEHIVTITVTDPHGKTATQTFTWTVSNPAPVAQNDSATTYEDTPLHVDASKGVLVNDHDPDGDSLSVISFEVAGTTYQAGDTATIAGIGELTLNSDGSYTFIPEADYNGAVPVITYTVADSDGGTDTATLTLAVEPVVDITLSAAPQVNEGDPITLTATVENPVQDKPLHVILNNGQTITIAVGDTSGSIQVDSRPDDAYIQGSENATFKVISASGGSEHIDDSSFGSTVTVEIMDTLDATSVALTANPDLTEAGGDLTYTLTLGNAVRAGDDPVEVSFKDLNGDTQSITIASGMTGSVTVTIPPTRFEDVYKETPENKLIATDVVVGGGANFETLAPITVGTIEIIDTIDPVYAQIAVDHDAVLEGDKLEYTVKLVDANGDPAAVAADKDVTVQLVWSGAAANLADVDQLPASITIAGGDHSASFTITTRIDQIVELSEPLTVAIDRVIDNDGTDVGFESLQIDPSNNHVTAHVLDAPTIEVLDDNRAPGGQITVFEQGLSAGDNSHITDGVLRITAPSGLAKITVGGTEIILAQLDDLASTNQSITIAGHGTITLTGATVVETANGKPAVWEVDFTYTLTDPQAHTAQGADEALKDLALGVTASDPVSGGDVSGAGTLGVLVVDDVPTVMLTGDKLDEAIVEEAHIGGAKGTATVNFSGAFDIDHGADGNHGIVYELVINAAATGLTDTATGDDVRLSDNNGTIEGRNAQGDVVFTIEVDAATGEVKLTQLRALHHDDPLTPNDSVKIVNGAIGLKATATDGDGDTASAEVNIGDRFVFQDDGPSAADDSANVVEGSKVDGNVLTNDEPGADGWDGAGAVVGVVAGATHGGSTGNVGSSINGLYGTLILRADGSYTYEATADAITDDAQDVFTYTVRDADGDISFATLAIDVENVSLTPAPITDTVMESGLPGGTTEGSGHTVTGQVNLPADVTEIIPQANVPTTYGVFTIGKDGTYSYTLTGTTVGDNTSDSFTYTATDANGNTVINTVTINIVDDVPQAVADTGSVAEGSTLTGNVLSNDKAGADGWHNLGAVVGVAAGDTKTNGTGGIGGKIDGQYGYLILDADGSYEYVSTANAVTADAVDVFTYTVRDGDGDEAHATLTININDVTLSAPDIHATVHEKGLVGGSGEGDNSHISSGQVALPAGVEIIPQTNVRTEHGVFSIDKDGNYSYILTENTSGKNTKDSFTYTATDASGNTVVSAVTIDIVDDAPTARDDANSIDEDAVSISGNVIGGGSAAAGDVADSTGADGAGITAITSDNVAANSAFTQPSGDLVIEGEYGTLTIRPDGFYTYELNNSDPQVNGLKDGDTLTEAFTYTLTDGDNDSDTATLTITINGRTDGLPRVTVTDHNGVDVGHNSIAEDATAPVTGEFTVSAPDGLKEVIIGGVTITADQLADLGTTPVLVLGGEGSLTLTAYDPTTGKVTYSYQQTGTSKDHSGGDNSVTDTFPITVTDHGGDSSVPSDLVILITDTAPVAHPDTGSTDEDGPVLTGNVITDAGTGKDEIGADLTTATGVTSNNEPGNTATNTGGVLQIEGEYGTLTIQPDGSYTYELHNSAKVNALKDGDVRQEVFEYTITDSDGDSDSTTLSITINGNTDGSPSIVPDDDNGNGAIDGHNTVNESGLVGGSTEGDSSNIASGSIQINAADGLDSITIGGQSFTLVELQALSSATPSAAIAVAGGVLVLTGFAPGTSVGGVPSDATLQYTYTLTGERTHNGTEDESLLLDIPLSVTDAGNETFNGTLTIQVVDDVPEADTDTGNVTEGGTLTVDAAHGVLANDTAGADGWASTGAVVGVVAGDTNATSSGGVGGRIDGQYGYLILNADGSYEYVSTADAVTGDEVDIFTYTVRDGDGDLAHTTLTINVADVTLAPETTVDSVNESGLSGGTTEGDNSHTTSGQVNLPPGLEVVPGSGTTTHGTFTIDQDGNYSYTLTGNTSGDNTSDSFTYVTRDANGNTVENTVTINIVDDRPVAVDDVNSIPAGSYVEVTGELINGGLGGAGQDSVGADGATVTSVVNTPVGEPAGTPVTVPTDGTSTTITGQYGVLTIEADGSYSYQRNPGTPGGVEDVFTYTITDGDGDTDEATLTIDIGNATPSIRDLTSSVNGGELVFEEKHLADGSAPDSAQLTKSGDFTISSPDGIGSLVVGTVTVIENGVLTSTTTVITPQGHTLEITGYDPVTGRVTYEYTLTGREDHDQSTNDTELFDEIPVVLTDRDGEVANDTLSVRIIDDVPQAAPDTGSIAEDAVDPLEGNVRTNDERGADGATVTELVNEAGTSVAVPTDGSATTINGQYGVLTIEADGSYSYELDNDNAEVNALKDGETLTEEFTYTLTDGDGDSDNTTLTITINGRTDGSPSIVPNDDNGNGAIDGHNTVNESGLAGGSSAGDGSNIVDGTIQISAGDGLASISIGGQSFTLAELQALNAGSPSAAIAVEGGTLVLTGFTPGTSVGGVPTSGALQYTYTLAGERTHNGTEDESLLLDIPLSVTDAGDETVGGTLTIQVVDDVPTAEDDTADVAAGEFELEQNGNVLTNDTEGADGARVTSVTPNNGTETSVPGTGNLVIDGDYGKLTIHSDGSYSYQRNPGTPGDVEDVFTYTITDGDGDVASAELTIRIADSAPTVDIPAAGGGSTTVHESGLPDGSDNIPDRATTSGKIEFNSADGLGTVSLGGHTLTETDQTFPTTGPAGSLTARYEYDPVTGKGSIHYSSTLEGTTDGNGTSVSFPVVITDKDGDTAPAGDLVIDIVDDTPTARPDEATVTEGASVAGDVLVNDQSGADGWYENGDAVVGITSNNVPGNVANTITDALVIDGQYGTLTIAPDGSYTYESHANAVTCDEQDVFTYTVRDADGDEATATLTINVNDVTGIPHDTTGTVDEAGLPAGSDSSSDKETTGGSLNLADGWTVDPSSVGNQSSGTGTLTINADGSYSYELTSRTEDVTGVEETDTFTYTARDQYGNTVTNTVTITIIDDVPSVTLTGNALGEVQVDETTLGNSALADFSGAFTHHFGADGDNGDGLVYTLEVDTAASGLVDTLTGQDITLVMNGSVVEGQNEDGAVAFTISVDADGEVTLTQSRPLQHSDPNNHDDVLTLPAGSLKLTGTVTDGDGDTDSASVDIGGRFSFRDDGPTIGAAPAPGAVDEAYLTTGSGGGTAGLSTETGADLDVDFGADGQGSLVFSDDQVALRNWLDASGNTDITITGTGTSELSGTRGGREIFTVTLTVDASGQASYHFELKGALLHRSPTQDHELTFSYAAVDGDGDRANGTFRVDVKDDEPRSEITINVDEDDANGPFTTSADATQDNTTISMTDGGSALPGTPNGNDLDYDVGHGTVTVHEDGRITYAPKPDYSNHGSPDEFYVTVTEDDGTSQTIEVTVNVIPVADAPELTVDSNSVTTNEDEAIGLGLNAPQVTDNNDQSPGEVGDSPELLGLITLSGIPAGAALLDGTDGNAELLESTGGDITILLSDGPHLSDLLTNPPAGTLVMTTAQYEALQVLPPAESHANFTVGVRVTSYEVDEAGERLAGIDGAESTISVTVNVQAVTDGIDLTIHNGDDNYVGADSTANAVTLPAFDEDGSINLKDYLQITLDETGDGNSGADTDGSEQRWFEVSGVPVGWTVDGVLITTPGQSVPVTIPNDYNGASPSLPDIVIEPPADFSGDLDGVRVTLHAQDRDSDGPNPLGTQISDSVYLNLRVNPQGGDVAADDVTTEEDTAVAFLQHVRVTDTGTGNEIITEVEFSLPDGWVLVDLPAGEDTDWEMTGAGTTADPYIITSPNGTDLEEVLGDFTVLPPAHSSKDEDIAVRVTSTDTNTVGGNSVPHSDWRDLTIEVEVTPKGERVADIGNPDRDTDGNNNPDLAMTPGRDYTTPGEEDKWFMLGQEAGFNLKDGWSNEDGRGVENGGTAGSGSEETFALLTPNLIAGDGSQADATGSEFQWGPVVGPDGARQFSEVFGGDPIEVPIEYLNTLEFKAAPHFSGMFEIKVQAKTVDYDEDHPNDESLADIQISGEATLTNILIAPKADTVTATVTARVEGDEDERMPLSIRPKSSDPSESFEVDIDGIPDGATLWYDGVELTSDADTSAWPNISITDNGDGTWKVEFTDFDPSKGGAMEIRAPQDSNEPFDLDIAIRSVDELHIPNPGGTPDPIIHRDVSSDYPLTITVAPKGIADEAIIDLIDYDDPITGVDPFTEADVDAAGGVMLSDLIVNAQLKDNDGSETLTFKISGLPDGFSIEGATFMGGSGTDREWSLTEAQLAGAKLVTPPNFNGSQTFDFYSVTTEDDNDSLTEQHSVELRVSPSPEATINLGASIDEDVSTRLDFSIQHRNGDADEVLEEVWISAADLAALGDLNLTYGQNGPSFADAAADAGNTSVVLDNGWYKLTGAAIDNVYAQGRENWHGDASFGVHYVIKDPALDSSVSDVSEGFDGTYGVTVNPITDQVTLDDPADISLNSPGNTGITLNIGNTGADYDGSEQLTRIILEDVPEGVVVVGTANYDVDFVGDGTWVLIPTGGSFNGLLTPSIALQVHVRAGGLDDHQIKVTVVTEDAGNGAESRASTEVGLTTNFAEGDPEAPATIERWEQTSFEPTEDVAFNLGQAIDAEIDATGVTNSGFTITLTDLPPGTQVTGMTRTMVNGEEVWSFSGQGGDAELQSLLSSITVTPPLDWNSNKGPFEYNATLTTHTPTGGRAQAELAVDQTVIPVTDDAAISIDMPAVDEGNDLAISINVSNPSDDPDWELIDGNLYLKLDESGMSAGGGMLLDASGNPLIPAPDGRYIIENVTPGTPINLTYVPSGPYVSGSISLEASVTGQENGAAGLFETTVSQQGDVNPINNGYDFDVNTSSGDEAPVAADKEHAIRLNITDNGLVDDDGSESITAILLKNLPNDFLVFVGENAASATLAEMANNAGGSGTNTWLLEPGADGNLPPYIAILPPKNWSGTLEDLELTVISGEGSRSDSATDTRTFNLEVNPVANGLAINPTPSFGREGKIIGLNLNARFEDLRQAGTTDESVERATVELKGLGEHAAIYVGGNLIMDRVEYNGVNDVYTITGLTQDEIDQLGFVQAAGDINNLQVRARTEEYEVSTAQPVVGAAPSDWTHSDWNAAPSISTTISNQIVTTGDDTLIWTGLNINGRAGEDTIQLRYGESLDGTELAAKLKNIEIIDLSVEGTNSITGLSVNDVLDMTDDDNLLTILGDDDDSVTLTDGQWQLDGSVHSDGGIDYQVYYNTDNSVTLHVQQGTEVHGVLIE